jgi:hypothetical protein
MESANIGSEILASEQVSPSENHEATKSVELAPQQTSSARAQKRCGPRTTIGKERSRGNATQHGLSAKVVLLEGESYSKLNSHLKGYRNYFNPVGIPEEDLVQDLALSKWQSRRMIRAMKAEIELEKKYDSRAADRYRQYREEAAIIEASVDAQTAKDIQTMSETRIPIEIPRPGLIASWNNPVIREKFLLLLKSLRKSIKLRSFFPDRDNQIISKLFGERTPSEFRLFYSFCAEPEPLTKHQQFKKFDLSLEERRSMFLTHLEATINLYEERAKRMDADSAKREKLESKSIAIPEASRLNLVLRYSACVDRKFARDLTQLLRLQQIRKGDPQPPTLNVNVLS